MHSLSEALGKQWIADFWAANHEMTWLAVEEERTLWLTDNTVLIGKMDARGLTGDGEPFFGEWKSKSGFYAGKRMAEVKQTWRRDPQALTYGLLAGKDANRFLVRWALKTSPPQTDFEWYTYTAEEMVMWKRELIEIADQIRSNRLKYKDGPWPLNFTNCYRYGVRYACSFVHTCPIEHNARVGPPRLPHLEIEGGFDAQVSENPNLVVLGSSRVRDYLECPENYRRTWEGEGTQEEGEALTIGSEFHNIVAEHITTLIKTEAPSAGTPQ